MNTDKLKSLFESSTDKYGDCKKIGITYEAMRRILAGGDMKVSTLEKIARFYNVPVGYFFDEASVDGRTANEMEIERLKGQVEGLREAVKILREEYETPAKKKKGH